MEYVAASNLVTLPVVLTDLEALALASAVQTMDWSRVRGCVGDDVQAFHLRSAFAAIGVGLSACGFPGATAPECGAVVCEAMVPTPRVTLDGNSGAKG
jgi:hypothetical protein